MNRLVVFLPTVMPTWLWSVCSSFYFAVPNYSDLAKVPSSYHNLREVFSKTQATAFPQKLWLCPRPPPRHGTPEREAMDQYITSLVTAGIIQPSLYRARAGFFFIETKDKTIRWCINYRGLNGITIKNRYPLPLISSAFKLLKGANVFTKLDLRNAYH